MDQKAVSTPDSPPPSASDSPQSVSPADPLPMAEGSGKEGSPPLPTIVLPPEEVVVPVSMSGDPLLDNPDYMALKKFVEERKVEGTEKDLSEESLIQ